jgi:hypothetical protein
MKNKSIEIKIEKMILMEKYVNIFIKNKDNNIFRNIFVMYVNDHDEELQKIKDKKLKKDVKKYMIIILFFIIHL